MKSLLPVTFTARRTRGGSFFTMLVFVMMLVSTGLMYYYFQRTRSLERQVMALQNGEVVTVTPQSGFLGLLGIGDTEDGAKLTSPPARVYPPPTEPEAVSQAQEPNLPNGAASTPRPTQSITPDSETLPPATETKTTPVLDLEMESAPAPGHDPSSPGEVPTDENSAESDTENSPEMAPEQQETEDPSQKKDLNSLYDAQPPVRVRAPQRNNR